MRLALCVKGKDDVLKEGKVYEVSPAWTCGGDVLVEAPAAKNWHVLSRACEDCGRDISITWFASRFIPINDADVTDGVKRDEEITA